MVYLTVLHSIFLIVKSRKSYTFESCNYGKYPLIRNSIFHLTPKNVSYSTRLSGNEDQCFLYEGYKVIALHMSIQCLIKHKAEQNMTKSAECLLKTVRLVQFLFLLTFR